MADNFILVNPQVWDALIDAMPRSHAYMQREVSRTVSRWWAERPDYDND